MDGRVSWSTQWCGHILTISGSQPVDADPAHLVQAHRLHDVCVTGQLVSGNGQCWIHAVTKPVKLLGFRLTQIVAFKAKDLFTLRLYLWVAYIPISGRVVGIRDFMAEIQISTLLQMPRLDPIDIVVLINARCFSIHRERLVQRIRTLYTFAW